MSTAQTQAAGAVGLAHATTVEQRIFTALSPVFGGAVFPAIAPDQTAPPFAVYSTISSTPENTLASGRPMSNDRIQVDVYARSKEEVTNLAALALAALDAIVSPTVGVYLISSGSAYEAEVRLHRVIQDFSISQVRSGL